MWGLVLSTCINTPFTTKVLLPSNSAENEWCASAGAASARAAAATPAATRYARRIMGTSSDCFPCGAVVPENVLPSRRFVKKSDGVQNVLSCLVQKIARGLTGEPDPPSTGSGANVIRNSYWRDRLAC